MSYEQERDGRDGRRGREKVTTGVENLKRLQTHYPTQKALGEAIGVTGSTVSTWLIDGVMPVTADLACQLLLGTRLIALRVRCSDMDQAMKLMGMLDLMGIEYEQERR